MLRAGDAHRHLVMQVLARDRHSAPSLCAQGWTAAILWVPLLISASAALHLPNDCLSKLLLLSVRVLAAIRLTTASLAQTSSFCFCLRLLGSCVFGPGVGDGHVAHVDVDDDVLPDEIADRDVVVR